MFKTFLKKLQVKLTPEGTVNYSLINSANSINSTDSADNLFLNPLLGKKITLQFTQTRQCVACKTPIKKIYQQGYCFPCTQKLASCDLCIVKPERCHFHLGTCREPNWGQDNCFIPHIVYLANTSGLKVGITRETQIPIRWIDQGASRALPILRVNSRYQAGLIEVNLAQHFQDKTDWRKMLKNEIEEIDLTLIREKMCSEESFANANNLNIQVINNADLLDKIEQPKKSLEYLTEEKVVNIQYPILENPKKIISLGLEKNPVISGTLLGIKGQYLILDTGVFNVRNHTGYEVEVLY